MKAETWIGHLVLLLMLTAVFVLVGVFAKQEANFKRQQEVIKQWHKDHPDDDRLIFNCVSPEFTIDCSKPWLKKES